MKYWKTILFVLLCFMIVSYPIMEGMTSEECNTQYTMSESLSDTERNNNFAKCMRKN
jgi:hypothetical protein